MEIVIVPDAATIGGLAADAVVALLARKPTAVLGLATGSSPLVVYAELIRRYDAGEVSFARSRGFLLDEYVGLPGGHPQTYRETIFRELTDALGIAHDRVASPDASDPQHAGARYEDAIRAAGGVDLQVLGIGRTGHIGFNEPGSSLASATRVKTLTEQTRIDNARFFHSLDEVPRHCLTQGLGTILRARHLLLFAFGEAKAGAIAGAVEGPVSSSLPGSAIQLHPLVTVIVDEAAASQLEHADYYRFAWDNRLDFER